MGPSMCYLQPRIPCHNFLGRCSSFPSHQTPLPKPGTLVEVLLSWLHLILFVLVGRSPVPMRHHDISGSIQSNPSIIEAPFPSSLHLPSTLQNPQSSERKSSSPLPIHQHHSLLAEIRGERLTLRNRNLERLFPSLLCDLSRTRARAQWTRPHSMLMLSG